MTAKDDLREMLVNSTHIELTVEHMKHALIESATGRNQEYLVAGYPKNVYERLMDLGLARQIDDTPKYVLTKAGIAIGTRLARESTIN